MFLMGFWEKGGIGLGSVIMVVCDMLRTSLVLRWGVFVPCMVICDEQKRGDRYCIYGKSPGNWPSQRYHYGVKTNRAFQSYHT